MKDSAFASRVGKINEILKQEGIDCFLVTPSSDMKYLLRHRPYQKNKDPSL